MLSSLIAEAEADVAERKAVISDTETELRLEEDRRRRRSDGMSELSSLRGSERYEVCDDDIPHSVFSFLHRRGAFFLFDKAEKKEWGSQKRRASEQYKV